MTEVLAAGKNSAQENSRIHRRHFRVEHAFSGFRVSEVVEKTAMVGHVFPEKTEGNDDALQCVGGGNEAPLLSYAESGKTEARRGNAGRNSWIVVVNVTAVLDHASFRVALFPEKKTSCNLQLV